MSRPATAVTSSPYPARYTARGGGGDRPQAREGDRDRPHLRGFAQRECSAQHLLRSCLLPRRGTRRLRAQTAGRRPPLRRQGRPARPSRPHPGRVIPQPTPRKSGDLRNSDSVRPVVCWMRDRGSAPDSLSPNYPRARLYCHGCGALPELLAIIRGEGDSPPCTVRLLRLFLRS